MASDKIHIIKSKKDFLSIIFVLIFVLIFIAKSERTEYFLNLLLTLIGLVFLYQLLWFLTGKVQLKIDIQKLYIKKSIIGLTFEKSYRLDEIENIVLKKDLDANSYWNFGGLLTSDKNPTIIEFMHKDKKVLIGKGCQEFNGQQIINDIKKAK